MGEIPKQDNHSIVFVYFFFHRRRRRPFFIPLHTFVLGCVGFGMLKIERIMMILFFATNVAAYPTTS